MTSDGLEMSSSVVVGGLVVVWLGVQGGREGGGCVLGCRLRPVQ